MKPALRTATISRSTGGLTNSSSSRYGGPARRCGFDGRGHPARSVHPISRTTRLETTHHQGSCRCVGDRQPVEAVGDLRGGTARGNMSKSKMPTWVSLILGGVGLLVVGIPGLFVYMKVTATKVHPDSQEIPAVMESPPPAKWAGAAEQARQIVRTSISENNLAGLSIAVGIDGEIVWTEGFGFADIENGSPVTPSHRFRTGPASIVLTAATIGLLLGVGGLKF